MALTKSIFDSTFSNFTAIIGSSRNLLSSIELIITNSYRFVFFVIILCTYSICTDGAFFLNDPHEHPLLSLQDEGIESINTATATTSTTSTITTTDNTTTTTTTTTITVKERTFRERAKTFGQNLEEIQKVKYYLEKIQKFEAEQHPEEIIQRHTVKPSSGAVRMDISSNVIFSYLYINEAK
uniref:Homeobox domain-containing protein n=1 Tax=Elaeophora elaphi TaxID=1147741 RepID=A0A0R3RYU5_9BILA